MVVGGVVVVGGLVVVGCGVVRVVVPDPEPLMSGLQRTRLFFAAGLFESCFARAFVQERLLAELTLAVWVRAIPMLTEPRLTVAQTTSRPPPARAAPVASSEFE